MTALAGRLAGSRAMESSASLWLETARAGRLPGVIASLRVAPPDRMRLVVRSPLGTLLDAAGEGDRVIAAIPRRRTWGEIDAAGESLGVARPVDLAVAILTASWRPAAGAWDASRETAGLRRIGWSEATRRIEMALDADGLPREVRLAETGGNELIVTYESYARSLGTRWPERLRLGDGAGQGRLRCRIERWRWLAPGDSSSLELTGSRGQRIEFATLRAWLDRLGEP